MTGPVKAKYDALFAANVSGGVSLGVGFSDAGWGIATVISIRSFSGPSPAAEMPRRARRAAAIGHSCAG